MCEKIHQQLMNHIKQASCKEQGVPVQSTGGSTNWGSAAQTMLSGLANNLNAGSQQAASAQSTGRASPIAECCIVLS